MNIKKYISKILFVLVAIFAIASFPTDASATLIDMSGNAWSGNAGWISFNCISTNTCGPNNSTAYKVVFDDSKDGALSGYAWSDNLGWIYFDPNLSSCPDKTNKPGNSVSNCAPKIGWSSASFVGSGYARVLGGTGTRNAPTFPAVLTDTWSGFVDLSGLVVSHTSVGGKRAASGYIWGSDIMGWIDMGGVFLHDSWSPSQSVTLTSSNQNLSSTSPTTTLTYRVTPASHNGVATTCSRTRQVNAITTSAPNDAWVGSNIVVPATGVVSVNYTFPSAGQATTRFIVSCVNTAISNTPVFANVYATFPPSVSITSNVNSVYYVQGYNSAGVTVGTPFSSPVANLTVSTMNTRSCIGQKYVGGILQPNDSSASGWSHPDSFGNWQYYTTPVIKNKSSLFTLVGPSDTTFSITCTNHEGKSVSTSKIITIEKPAVTLTALADGPQVSSGPNKNVNPAAVLAKLKPTPSTVNKIGEIATLTWSMSGFYPQQLLTMDAQCKSEKRVNGAIANGNYDFGGNIGGNAVIPWGQSIGKPISNSLSRRIFGGPSTATYSVTCTNSYTKETATASVIIPVYGSIDPTSLVPTITSFTGNGASPLNFSTPTSGGNINLAWTATNAIACDVAKMSPTYVSVLGSSAYPAVSTTSTAPVNQNSTYRVTCFNGSNSATRLLNVNVGVVSPPSFISAGFQATRNPVTTTDRNTGLYWGTTGATYCDLYNSTNTPATKLNTSSQLPANRTAASVYPTSSSGLLSVISVAGNNQKYTLQCFNSSGASVSRELQVNATPPMPPVVANLLVDQPDTGVPTGTNKTVSWTVSNATSCIKTKTSGTNPDSNWTGSLSAAELLAGSGSSMVFMGPANTTEAYRISCTNTDNPTPVLGNASVGVVAAPIPPVIVSFTAFPPITPPATKYTPNASVVLNWTSTPAGNTCSVSQTLPVNRFVSSGGSNGSSSPVTIMDKNETYTLTCIHDFISRSQDLPLEVDPLTKKIKVIER